jgi:hypothetical protein
VEVCPPQALPLFLPPSSLDYWREPHLLASGKSRIRKEPPLPATGYGTATSPGKLGRSYPTVRLLLSFNDVTTSHNDANSCVKGREQQPQGNSTACTLPLVSQMALIYFYLRVSCSIGCLSQYPIFAYRYRYRILPVHLMTVIAYL